jgi:hypothetical protein
MPVITLTEDQARVLNQAGETSVVVQDPAGTTVGVLDPRESAAIAEAKRRMSYSGPCFTAEQVRNHMAALQAEWDRAGGFDQEYMQRFLAQLRDNDPPRTNPDGSPCTP